MIVALDGVRGLMGRSGDFVFLGLDGWMIRIWGWRRVKFRNRLQLGCYEQLVRAWRLDMDMKMTMLGRLVFCPTARVVQPLFLRVSIELDLQFWIS